MSQMILTCDNTSGMKRKIEDALAYGWLVHSVQANTNNMWLAVMTKPDPAPTVKVIKTDYAWATLEAYEKDAGFKVGDAFAAGWKMARTTNDLFKQMQESMT